MSSKKIKEFIPHPMQHLAEIGQTSKVQFSLASVDGKSEATYRCMCRDFLSDVVAQHWGMYPSVSIYGFVYSGEPRADVNKIIVFNAKPEPLATVMESMGYSVEECKVGDKSCLLVDCGHAGESTVGMSAITHLIRCCDYAGSECKTVEDALVAPTKKGSSNDATYSKAILEKHGSEWFERVLKMSPDIGAACMDNKQKCGSVHNYGGIFSLANGVCCWQGEVNKVMKG